MLQRTGRSDYPDWVLTVQLKCFVKSVRFIKAFEYISVTVIDVWVRSVQYPNFSGSYLTEHSG